MAIFVPPVEYGPEQQRQAEYAVCRVLDLVETAANQERVSRPEILFLIIGDVITQDFKLVWCAHPVPPTHTASK